MSKTSDTMILCERCGSPHYSLNECASCGWVKPMAHACSFCGTDICGTEATILGTCVACAEDRLENLRWEYASLDAKVKQTRQNMGR